VKKVTLASVFLCLLFPVVALADQGDVMQIKIGQPATLKPQVADRKKLPLPEVATALPVGAGPVVNVEKPWYMPLWVWEKVATLSLTPILSTLQ